MKKKFSIFFSLRHPLATHECPQKVSAQSVQPFGRPPAIGNIFIYECLVLLYKLKIFLALRAFYFQIYIYLVFDLLPPYLINNYSYKHYASIWHVFPQPLWRSGGDYIRRGLRETKENGRLMLVFRRLLMTSERPNTEL